MSKVTWSLIFHAVLALSAVALRYVVVGVTLIVEPVSNTSSVVGVILVISSPVPLDPTAVPIAEALKYFVVIVPFPVATVTSPEFPEAIVIVGSY